MNLHKTVDTTDQAAMEIVPKVIITAHFTWATLIQCAMGADLLLLVPKLQLGNTTVQKLQLR
jgi:hypothetical protein